VRNVPSYADPAQTTFEKRWIFQLRCPNAHVFAPFVESFVLGDVILSFKLFFHAINQKRSAVFGFLLTFKSLEHLKLKLIAQFFLLGVLGFWGDRKSVV